MESKLTKEQRAHDLAVILCQRSISGRRVKCDHGDVFDFVKEYEHYYKYVLKSFEDTK